MQRRALLPVMAAPFLPIPAMAQGWSPDRPLRFLVGFAAGGSTDTTARVVAEAISGALGQQVVVENRTGAGGNIASEYVARSAPDGYTLVVGSMGTHATNQALYRNMAFHVQRDFAPVSLIALSSSVLCTHPSVPVARAAELVARAKANPGGMNCGTAGPGSSQHFAAALFEHVAGIRFTQIAFRGGAPAMQELVAGRLDCVFSPVVEAIQMIRAGQLRAIGITGGDRLALLPGVPTLQEDVPGYVFSSWLGLFAPANTPAPVLARLSGEVARAMRDPRVKERMEQLGYQPVGSTPEEFASFQARELPRTAELVRLSGATAE